MTCLLLLKSCYFSAKQLTGYCIAFTNWQNVDRRKGKCRKSGAEVWWETSRWILLYPIDLNPQRAVQRRKLFNSEWNWCRFMFAVRVLNSEKSCISISVGNRSGVRTHKNNKYLYVGSILASQHLNTGNRGTNCRSVRPETFREFLERSERNSSNHHKKSETSNGQTVIVSVLDTKQVLNTRNTRVRH